ncbi:Endoribonuclease YSH1 [Fasciola gigantica]|uniref:Endoribonuclease YSH1 n=1 Tax=Fasciola gigantica TaxID=46835 RepID=A0A504YUB6_FASGI|nr:Endoribonuclease YSH1 [Fasciola gigantica]
MKLLACRLLYLETLSIHDGGAAHKVAIGPISGAGQEVGRSCILLTFKGKKIILDCGIHPGLRNKESLPFIDAVPEIETTDLVLISHFHLDHSGGLPHLLLKTGTKSKCYTTHATKAIYRYLLADFVRVSNSSGVPDQSLYTDRDILASLERIDTLDFHQELEVNGIKFTAYHAGHVLGAAMFLIEIAGVKVDEYWAAHPELHDVPHLLCQPIGSKMYGRLLNTYHSSMNDVFRNQVGAITSRVCFRQCSNLKSIEHFDDSGPCVVMASPGMMQSGLSRELFENWCTDKRNGVIIAGYCVEGTPAKQILSLPAEIPTMSGQTLPLKCSVDYISFSAHTDYQQTSAFIRELKPSYVILVHGEQNEMLRLAGALQREYEDDETCRLEIFTPKNCVPVTMRFRGEKIAKVLGSLARNPPKEGQQISGVLVKKNFAYHILTPKELPTYTELATTTVGQLISIPFTGSANLLKFHLTLLAGTVKLLTEEQNVVQFCVFGAWQSNPTNDMYADAVQNVVLRAAMQGLPPRGLPQLVEPDQQQIRMALEVTLQDAFGTNCLKTEQIDPDAKSVQVVVDYHVAEIDLDNLTVRCETNAKLEHIIRVMVHRLNHCISAV